MAAAPQHTWLYLLLTFAPLLIGMVLFILGLRGRKLDDHPVCRKCRYDLCGTPDAAACPECGRDLKARWAVRVGNRRRRRVPLVAGPLMIVLSLGVIVTSLSGTNLNPYKPFWLLKLEATTPALGFRSRALDELITRVQHKTLTPAQLDELLATALRVQADTSITWDTKWGHLYCDLLTQGVGTMRQHKQYAEHLYSSQIYARRYVRRGDPIPAAISILPSRGQGDEFHGFDYKPVGERFEIAGLIDHKMTSFNPNPKYFVPGQWPDSRRWIPTDQEPFDQLDTGEYTLECTALIEVTPGMRRSPMAGTTELSSETTITLLPTDTEDDIELYSDPAAAASLDRYLPTQQVNFDTGLNGHHINISDVAWPNIKQDLTGFTFAYRVYVRHNGQEWPTNKYFIGHGSRSEWITERGEIPRFVDTGRVTLIYRPDKDAARRTLDVYRILDHEFVIKDVQIVRQP